MCQSYNLIGVNPRVYLNEDLNDAYVFPNEFNINIDEDDEDDEEDEDVLIIYIEMNSTIREIEENIANGIDIKNIFIFVDRTNEYIDDIWDLLLGIYSRLNFIFE